MKDSLDDVALEFSCHPDPKIQEMQQEDEVARQKLEAKKRFNMRGVLESNKLLQQSKRIVAAARPLITVRVAN